MSAHPKSNVRHDPSGNAKASDSGVFGTERRVADRLVHRDERLINQGPCGKVQRGTWRTVFA